MLEGTWRPASESARLGQCGRSLIFPCGLTLATFGVALLTAYGLGDPRFINLSAALHARIYGEEDDPEFMYQGFTALNDTGQARANADKEAASANDVAPSRNGTGDMAPFPKDGTLPALSGKAKLIFVNCAEDGKSVKKRGWQSKVLPCRHQCNMTVSKADLARADAVVFNPLWMSPLKSPPKTKVPGQIWAYSFHFESASAHGFARSVTKALSGNVDLTMTYKGKSDIFRPFYSLRPLRPDEAAPAQTDFAQGKQHLLLWLVGNCGAKKRMALFKGLQKLLGPDKAHLLGACGQRTGCKSKHSSDPCNLQLMSKYKFYAAFENGRCEGYITEKFFRGLMTSMVPLALGGKGRKDYEYIAPPEAFLHVDDFTSMEALAKALLEIDSDDARYNRFHAWRQKYKVASQRATHDAAYCDLCDRLHGGERLHPRSYGPSLERWMFDGCLSDGPRW